MASCYASHLGDCAGRIEDEHFIPASLQKMMGSVAVRGMAWQNGTTHQLPPRKYAHGRVICRKHHDALDGLDGNARDYFKNLMLAAAGGHITTGQIGSSAEIASPINGRSLEKWFLKTICGAIATGNVVSSAGLSRDWVDALFSKTAWPDTWAIHISSGDYQFLEPDASVHMDFVWSDTGHLLGLLLRAFCVTTLFCLEPPHSLPSSMMHRPPGIGFSIRRPSGGNVLSDIPADGVIKFMFSWPSDATVDGP